MPFRLRFTPKPQCINYEDEKSLFIINTLMIRLKGVAYGNGNSLYAKGVYVIVYFLAIAVVFHELYSFVGNFFRG